MKKKFIVFIAALMMAAAGLTGHLHAGENVAPKAAGAVGQAGVSKTAGDKKDAGAMTAEEVRKTGEAKKSEEERKNSEEAKKILVAKVNGAEINMLMLVRAMNRVAPKYVKAGDDTTPEITAKIRAEALDKLIFEELAVQEAMKQDINPGPEAIDNVIAEVRRNLGTEEAYKEYLDNNNLTEEELGKLIERSRRLELITAKEVYGKVKVDEKLLQDEYEKEKNKYILPENLVVEDVWFLKGKDESIRKKAEETLLIIKKNNNNINKLSLDGTFIVRKITVKKEKQPGIYNAVTDLKVGDLTGIIDDKDGLHIAKVLKKDPSRQATFEEAKATIEPKFLYPAQEQRRKQWEKELRETSKIELFANDIKKNAVKQEGK